MSVDPNDPLAPRRVAQPKSPVAMAVAKVLEDEDNQTRQTIIAAPAPEQVARETRVARQLDVPPVMVQGRVDEAEKSARANQWVGLTRSTPALLGWSQENTRGALVAQGDIDNLQKTSKVWGTLPKGPDWAADAAGPRKMEITGKENTPGFFDSFDWGIIPKVPRALVVSGFNSAMATGARMNRSLLVPLGNMFDQWSNIASPNTRTVGEVEDQAVAREAYWKAGVGSAEKRLEEGRGEQRPGAEQTILTALESMPRSVIAAVVTAVTRNPSLGAGIISAPVGTDAYHDAKEAGLSTGASINYGLTQSLAEWVTEISPTGTFAEILTKRLPFGKGMAKELGQEVAGENVATVLQDLADWIYLPENKNKTFTDYLEARPQAALETTVGALAMVGASGAIAKSTHLTQSAISATRNKITGARREAAAITALGELAKSSKLRGLDKEAHASVMQALGDASGRKSVFIPGETVQQFMQSDAYDADTSPLAPFAGQIAEAAAAGTDVVLPVGAVMSEMPGTPEWNALKDHMRLDPGGASAAEAEFMAQSIDQIEQKFTQDMDTLKEEMTARQDVQAKIASKMAAKLAKVGYTADAAQTMGEQMATAIVRLRQRSGQEPTEAELDNLTIRMVLPQALAQMQQADQTDAVVAALRENAPALRWISEAGGVDALTELLRGAEGDVAALLDETMGNGLPALPEGLDVEAITKLLGDQGGLDETMRTAQMLGELLASAGYAPGEISDADIRNLLAGMEGEGTGARVYEDAGRYDAAGTGGPDAGRTGRADQGGVPGSAVLPYHRGRLEAVRALVQRAAGSVAYLRGEADGASDLGGIGLARFEPSEAIHVQFGERNEPVAFTELEPVAGSPVFHSAISAFKDDPNFPHRAAVYAYPVEDYAAMRLFLSDDGQTGFAIKGDGNLVSLFSAAPGRSFGLLELAKQEGATKLDAFDIDGFLPSLYAAHGFTETARDPWNEEYAPDDWPYADLGKPPVVYMELDAQALNGVGGIYDQTEQLGRAGAQGAAGAGLLAGGAGTGQGQAGQYPAANGNPAGASPQADGRRFRDFFSNVTSGRAGRPDVKNTERLIDVAQINVFATEYGKHAQGDFDAHIEASIPSFRDVQYAVGAALAEAMPAGSRMLDIAGSEGALAKAISAMTLGTVSTVVLDPNQKMQATFLAGEQVPGASFVLGAFSDNPASTGKVMWTEPALDGSGEVEISGYAPDAPFDVIHEAMGFQFIHNGRKEQVARVKEMLAPGGVAIFEEKFVPGDGLTQQQWDANEAKKDQFKRRFFSDEDIKAKAKDILKGEQAAVGMNDLMVSPGEMEQVLASQFRYVVQFWDAGNFKGYMASDSDTMLTDILNKMLPVETEFSTVGTPRAVAGADLLATVINDSRGNPLVTFHGTPFDFVQFRSPTGKAIWFAEDKRKAAGYANPRRVGRSGDGRIVSATLRATKPLVIEEDVNATVPNAVAWAKKLGIDIVATGWQRAVGSESVHTIVRSAAFSNAARIAGYDVIQINDGGSRTWGILNRNSVKDSTTGRTLYQSAWHGSPHTFDSFSLEFIGSGEGNQAFGWGLYFAGRKQVAEHYRDTLASGVAMVRLPDGASRDLYQESFAQKLVERGVSPEAAQIALRAMRVVAKDVREDLDREHFFEDAAFQAGAYPYDADEVAQAAHSEAETAIQKLSADGAVMTGGGRLYNVDIPEDSEFLMWDAPLAQQSDHVKAALRQMYEKSATLAENMGKADEAAHYRMLVDTIDGVPPPAIKDPKIASLVKRAIAEAKRDGGGNERMDVYLAIDNTQALYKEAKALAEAAGIDTDLISPGEYVVMQAGEYFDALETGQNQTGARLYADLSNDMWSVANGNPDMLASLELRDNGIAGIRYYDAGSRATPEGESSNYVVFDDSRVKIRELFQRDVSEVFYSALERAVQNVKAEKAPAAQWIATLKNAPGVKAEEVEVSGLMEWLQLQDGPVSKAAVIDLLQKGGVHFEETWKGRGPDWERMVEAAYDEIAADAMEQYENWYDQPYWTTEVTTEDEEGNEVTKWAVRTNFDREPISLHDTEEEAQEAADEANAEQLASDREDYENENAYQWREDAEQQVDREYGPKWKSYSNFEDEDDANYREWLLRLPLGTRGNQTKPVRTHWEEMDVLAHGRMADVSSYLDGERLRTLHIDEIQSDAHQQARARVKDAKDRLDNARLHEATYYSDLLYLDRRKQGDDIRVAAREILENSRQMLEMQDGARDYAFLILQRFQALRDLDMAIKDAAKLAPTDGYEIQIASDVAEQVANEIRAANPQIELRNEQYYARDVEEALSNYEKAVASGGYATPTDPEVIAAKQAEVRKEADTVEETAALVQALAAKLEIGKIDPPRSIEEMADNLNISREAAVQKWASLLRANSVSVLANYLDLKGAALYEDLRTEEVTPSSPMALQEKLVDFVGIMRALDMMGRGQTRDLQRFESMMVGLAMSGGGNWIDRRLANAPYGTLIYQSNYLRNANNDLDLRLSELFTMQNGGQGIANLPFKKSWPDLVMKRMIAYAVDNGYEAVTWIKEGENNGGKTPEDKVGWFYERDLVNITNKLIKKYGTRVEWMHVPNFDPKEGVAEEIDQRRAAIDAAVEVLKEKQSIIKRVSQGIERYTVEEDARAAWAGSVERLKSDLLDFEARLARIKQQIIYLEDTEGEATDPAHHQTMLESERQHATQIQRHIELREEVMSRSFEDVWAAAKEWQSANDEILALISEKAKMKSPTNLGFRITPELREAFKNQQPMFQRGSEVRGRILLGDDSATIELFQSRDLSTPLHEFGHYYLEQFWKDADLPTAEAQLAEDKRIVTEWFEANGYRIRDGVIPTGAHEMWARGLELYHKEGKAPTPALKSVFERFWVWLTDIYKKVEALNVKITPEIREVFDRMYATQEELDAARAMMKLNPFITDATEMGMSEQELAAYNEMVALAKAEAKGSLLEKAMKPIRARELGLYRARRAELMMAIGADVDNRALFRALRRMKTDRMDREWLVEQFGEDVVNDLPVRVPPIFKADGTDPEVIAEMAGFGSAKQMVNAILAAEIEQRQARASGDKRTMRDRTIQTEVDAEMARLYGDPLNDGSIQEEAMAVVANEQQGEVLAAEIRYLTRATGKKGVATPYRMARDWARGRVLNGTYADEASPSAIQRHIRNVAKAGRAAEQALIEGNKEEALRRKQQQMLSLALLAEAKAANEQVNAARKRLDKIASKRTMKTVEQSYLEQAHALLEAVDLKKRTNKSEAAKASFAQWAKAQADNGIDVVVPEDFAERMGQTNWSVMPISQLLGLDDTIKQIIHLGRYTQTLIDNDERRTWDEIYAEAEKAADNIGRKPPKGSFTDPTWWDDIRSGVASMDAALLKMEQVFLWLDQNKPNGVFTRIAFRPIADAQAREQDMVAEYTERVRKAMEAIPAKTLKTWANKVTLNLIDQQTGLPASMIREKLIAMALNWGNEGNRQRLADGYGWSQDGVEKALMDNLSKEEWDFVQSVWTIVNDLWPEIAAMERRVNGVEPEKIEAVQVVTPHGTYEGGYYPAIYDPVLSYRAEEHDAEAGDKLFAGAHTKATTRASSTKERSEAVKRPILLDIGVITRHLGETIHDLTHREAVMQAYRLLTNPRVMKAVDDTLGREIRGQFKPWVQHVANSWAIDRAGNQGWAKFMSNMRANTTVMGMGFRFTTILTQIAGYSSSFEFVGTKWVTEGIFRFLAHPMKTYRFVMERSGEVRHRMDTLDRDIRAAMKREASVSGALTAAKRFAFHGIGYMDRVVTIPTWIGAYNKAIAQGLSEEDAAYQGDQAVRLSQGAGAAKDLAAVQTGKGTGGQLFQFLTTFYSFVSAYFQRQRSFGRDLVRAKPKDIPDLMARAWWLFVVTPLLPELIKMAMGAGSGPDDDEGWGWWSFKKMLGQQFSAIPFVRDIYEPIWNGVTGTKGFDYKFTPAQAAGESAVRLAKDVGKMIEGEETKQMTRNTLDAIGYATGITTGQINASTQFVIDIATGDQNPQTLGEFMEGVTTGKIKEDK